jgi:AcrR family transcriptional regulator
MVSQRLTRVERKERTRTDIVAAARESFLRHGFHGASLDLIADEAGYTKGAVYSSFAGKDDLFLAVLDANFEQRRQAYTELLLDQERIEDAYRVVARFLFESDRDEPQWAPLLLEFWAHASRRDELRAAVAERRERFLDAIAQLIADLAERYGVAFRIPTKEVARGSGALMRGMGVEWTLRPGAVDPEVFEEMHAAYMRGLTERSTP